MSEQQEHLIKTIAQRIWHVPHSKTIAEQIVEDLRKAGYVVMQRTYQ